MLTLLFLLAVLLIVFGRTAVAACIVGLIFACGIFVLFSIGAFLALVVSTVV